MIQIIHIFALKINTLMKRAFLILCLCISTSAFAGHDISFKKDSRLNHSPMVNIKVIGYDSRGFIWLGTPYGVDRFDGFSFREYRLSGTAERQDLVSRISEDGAGNLWALTKNGCFIYDRYQDAFADCRTSYLPSLGFPGTEGEIFISDGGNIWMETPDSLICYVFSERKLHCLAKTDGADVLDVADRNGEAFILFSSGQFHKVDFLRDKLNYENTLELSSFRWHYIYMDDTGDLWLYTAHSPVDGLKCYSIKDRKWHDYPSLHALDGTIITSVTNDRNDQIWIGTEDEGIYVLDKADGSLTHHDKNSTDGIIPNNHINKICCDLYGHIWASCYEGGIVYAISGNNKFSKRNPNISEMINAMAEDRNGGLWIGTDGNGVLNIDADGKSHHYSKENKAIDSNIITSAFVDSMGTIWVGTFTGGVQYFSKGAFHQLPDRDVTDHTTASIQTICEDSSKRLWIGTNSEGLFYVDIRDKSIHLLDEQHALTRNRTINDIVSDAGGLLYVSTSQGLLVYDSIENRVVVSDNALHLPGNDRITMLYSDLKGRIWLGGTKGIYRLDKSALSITKINDNPRYPDFHALSVSEDRKGNIWAGTDQGLICITGNLDSSNPDDYSIRRYVDESGLEGASFRRNASLFTSRGECLISSANDILLIDTDIDNTDEYGDRLYFTGLYLFNEAVNAGDGTGILSTDISLTDRIKLKYNQNNFMLDLSLLDINRNNKVIYEYRVPSSGNQWTTLQSNRIMMNALQPGQYTIEARATDQWGWESNIVSLNVWIKPHILKSPVAVVLYICFLLLSLLLFLKTRTDSKKMEQELMLQKEIDENKTRFFANINHDIRTPLTLIMSPLENAMNRATQPDIRKDLELAYKNAGILMDEFSQLLDIKNLNAGSENIHYSRGDIASFVKDVVGTYKEYVKEHGQTIQFSSTPASLDADFDKSKMRRILMNLISNSVKYNVPGGKIAVSLSAGGNDRVIISVADTGQGIRDSEKESVFTRFYQSPINKNSTGSGLGLHIVKEYVTMHNGKVSIEDNQPQGTVIKIDMPKFADNAVIDDAVSSLQTSMTEKHDDSRTKILVVEDSDELRTFLKKCLEVSYDIITATNGQEALDIIHNNDVNLIISDIMMPQMDGLELCTRIKNDIDLSHIPIILLTAKNTEFDILTGLKNGADEYIIKPFNLEILKYRINKLLDWSETNHKKISKGILLEPSEITVSSLDEQLISKAIKVVEENMDNIEFSVEDLSMAVGMTRGHLYKKLMFIMGVSPVQFIRIIRLKRGKSLLEQGWSNISDVAYAVGYSPKQFSKHFKEIYGCLPSKYNTASEGEQ